jgi:hypothetical protein
LITGLLEKIKQQKIREELSKSRTEEYKYRDGRKGWASENRWISEEAKIIKSV